MPYADLIALHPAAALQRKADEFAGVVKSGRTHLMDATPVTLGQEFGGYAAQVSLGVERLEASLPRVAELPLRGTAVGTGINTPPGFAERVIDELARSTGLAARHATTSERRARAMPWSSCPVSCALAVSLFKISNDIRWMVGPHRPERDLPAGPAARLLDAER